MARSVSINEQRGVGGYPGFHPATMTVQDRVKLVNDSHSQLTTKAKDLLDFCRRIVSPNADLFLPLCLTDMFRNEKSQW